ncbi:MULTISPECIES: DUF6924 domain-containing protein [unclassified Streptomyces]|uniref:DUF6924 domain-containing protein n=1 Tax=unclassified Streptomyces TaxID=2593676 RepID=UPI002DDAA4BA|nr:MULTISPECIES: hypothetical protein [unclassified Streptomyces]WSA90810.1 hypothetical protein OIE63_04095 [Streptomyces sp. NBC_01795]WSB75132.1 hypothetical protein OHB04_04625 [Streptomyces sp. NBC_01775]WSS16585.1 hypothetical protein OG533_35275 [Streptomyces sp. NBC_01186]WSS45403.1 hypothetical protein OG220_35960 [Streptomyces sp. NBC_01187]
MQALLDLGDRGDFDAVVVRTDYDDEQAWQAVKAALAEPSGESHEAPTPCLVDDPAWAGAGVEEVLAAIAADARLHDELSVVFLADRTTMRAGHHPLLAVPAFTREDLNDDEAYEEMVEFGCEFRTVSTGVHEIHTNLALANMDFQDFAAAAQADPSGVFRSWWKSHA